MAFSPAALTLLGAASRGQREPRVGTSFSDFCRIRSRIKFSVHGKHGSVKNWRVDDLDRWQDQRLAQTGFYFCANPFTHRVQFVSTRRTVSIQHIKRDLRVKYRLPYALKRQQLPRLTFQFFDALAARLGHLSPPLRERHKLWR